jgi:hypothetical protein
VNPNFYTIGMELEGEPSGDWPDGQIAGTAMLLADVARRWGLAIDADHVIPHSAIRSFSGCPEASCPLARIIETAGGETAAAAVPRQTVVRTLGRTNLREGASSLRGRIVRVIPAGTEVVITAFTDSGERVEGNSCWYVDGEGHFLWAGATDVPTPTTDEGAPSALSMDAGSTDAMGLFRRPEPRPAADINLSARVDRTTLVLPVKEFVTQETRKDLIVLHSPPAEPPRARSIRGGPTRVGLQPRTSSTSTARFTRCFRRRSALPILVSRTQTAYTTAARLASRSSMSVRCQPSTEDPKVLNWWPPKTKDAPDFTTKSCDVDETDKYVKAPFRMKTHFASFANAQVGAVSALLRALCNSVLGSGHPSTGIAPFRMRPAGLCKLQGRLLARELPAGQVGYRPCIRLGPSWIMTRRTAVVETAME